MVEYSDKTGFVPENRKSGKIIESLRDLPEFAVQIKALRKIYVDGRRELEVLHGLDLEVRNGEIIAIVGPSGAGKSTLLHTVGLMDQASSGDLTVLGFDIQRMKEKERDQLRNKYIGFLFQFHYLLPELTLLENAALPLRIAGVALQEATERAMEMLGSVGLKERVGHFPSEVSGGEQQRAALARAMIHKPALLLCDEPTGNLDLERGEEVRDLIWRTARAQHSTVLIATHNPDIAKTADRIVKLVNGTVVSSERVVTAAELQRSR